MRHIEERDFDDQVVDFKSHNFTQTLGRRWNRIENQAPTLVPRNCAVLVDGLQVLEERDEILFAIGDDAWFEADSEEEDLEIELELLLDELAKSKLSI